MSKSLSLGAIALVLLSGCSGGTTNPKDPFAKACDTVMCGKGHCVLDVDRPACLCDAEFKPEGLACVPVKQPPPDKCKPNPCVQQNRRTCSVVNDAVQCACDPGSYESEGQCIPMTKCSPNPCAAKNQTTCAIAAGAALCSCNAGYAPATDGGCGADKVFDCAAQHSGPSGDAFEPDECPTLGGGFFADDLWVSGHTLAPAGDADWFQLTTEAGHVYRVNASGMNTLALYVDVYAENGATPVGFDHRGVFNPSARFKAAVAGHSYVRIRAFRAGDTGPYDLVVTDLGLDDFADTPELAGPAAIGGQFAGDVQFPADVDVVKIPLPEGNKYALGAVDAGTGSTGLTLELIGVDGMTVTRRSLGAPLGIITRSKATGDYFLQVSGGTAGNLGHFELALTDLGPDDHGDVPAEATTLTPSSTAVAAKFETATDIDSFTFDAQAGHIYSFLCTSTTGGYYGCLTSITDAAGTILATSSSGYSSVVTYEFTQPGPFFVRTSTQYAYGAQQSQYTYRFEDLGVDDFGDTPATSAPITVGGMPTAGRIETTLDKDVFSFATAANHIYRATCVGGMGLGSCLTELMNAAGTVVATSGYGGGASWESAAAGTLYVQLSGSAYGGSVGSYTLTVEDLGTDDFGDTIATASPLTPSSNFATGSLESAPDIDVFSFTAAAPNVYRFTCTTVGAGYGGCSLRLKSSSGSVVQTSGSSSGTAQVAIEATSAGTWYVEVFNGYGSGTGSTTYTYRLENLGPDDYGDDRLSASPILATGAAATGRLETPTDVDAFSFSATALHIYKFSCTITGYPGCTLTMRNALGNLVATGSGAGSGTSAVAFEPQTAGTYTVEVSTGYIWSSDPYTFSLEDLGLDDHGDTPATATALSVPAGPTNAVIEASNDVDVFSFSVTASHIYRFTAVPGSGLSLQVRLKDATGTVLATAGYSPSTVNYKAPANGTWYAEVSSNNSYNSTGTYSYSVVDVGLDDHGDSVSTATPLPGLGTPVAGNLEYVADEDFFSIALGAGTAHQVLTSGTYVYVTVYTPSGVSFTYEQSAPVSFNATVAGTYFVRVRYPYSGAGGGSYTVRVQ